MSIERCALALVRTGGDVRRAAEWAQKTWPSDGRTYRALGAETVEAGGALLGGEVDNDFIRALRSTTVVRRMGARSVPLPFGQKLVPKVTVGAEVFWIGENENVPASEQKTGAVRFDARKLAALVPVRGTLMRYAAPLAERLIRTDLIQGVAAGEDVGFIRGDGGEHTPLGMRHRAPASHVITANATVNLANVVADLEKAMAVVQDADVPMVRPGWLFAPRTHRYLSTLRDGNGWAFKDELAKGTLLGWPFGVTTGIPTDLGAGSDESEVYYADFNEAAIADGVSLVDVAEGAAYFESSEIRAAYSAGDWCVRIIRETDFSFRHEEAVSVLTAVTWGA